MPDLHAPWHMIHPDDDPPTGCVITDDRHRNVAFLPAAAPWQVLVLVPEMVAAIRAYHALVQHPLTCPTCQWHEGREWEGLPCEGLAELAVTSQRLLLAAAEKLEGTG